ncbi:MAG: DUF2066 domain-containing protein [Gammaproteobacteria bacterium]|nr:DUF2066 domain-containing protein [Gammaproteobacteria bacterium]
MTTYLRGFICHVILLIGLSGSVAMAQEGRYLFEIAVRDQGNDEYQTAVRLGLGEVIARVAGNTAVLQRPEVQEALDSSGNFVDQYQYSRLDDASAISDLPFATPSVKTSTEAAFMLVLSYSPEAVGELIGQQDQSLGTSDSTEASTLFWMVVEKDGSSQIVGGDGQADVRARISELAAQVGLNAIFPLMDLQDHQALGVVDIRGGFEDRIRAASARYETDSVVTGLLKQENNELWLSSWTRFAGGGTSSFANNALNLDSVISSGVEWVAQLARRDSAISGGTLRSASSTQIWVGGIDSTERYVRVARLLEELPGVETITPSYMSGQGMMFSISPRLSVMQLQQNLARVSWLRQSAQPAEDPYGKSVPQGAELFFDYTG